MPSTIFSRARLGRVPAYLIVGLYALFVLSLVAWVLLASLSTTRNIFTGNLLAFDLSFDNFAKVLTVNGGLGNIGNTIVYVVPSCLLILLLSAPAAYAIARFPGNLNGLIEGALVFCMGIPSIIVALSVFPIVSRLGLGESRLVLIALYVAMHVPFNVFFLISYFRNIPPSYEEAAAIEGAGPLRTFWDVILPFVHPALMVLTIFNFISLWNEYFLALIFANTNELRPISLWLQTTINAMKTTGDWAGMFAAVTVAAAPTVFVYAVLANRLIDARASGGLK